MKEEKRITSEEFDTAAKALLIEMAHKTGMSPIDFMKGITVADYFARLHDALFGERGEEETEGHDIEVRVIKGTDMNGLKDVIADILGEIFNDDGEDDDE